MVVDYLVRSLFRFLVDRFAVVNCSERVLFGVPVISFNNGVDLDGYQVKSPSLLYEHVLRMVFVGNPGSWHGLDRILKGMHDYYDQQKSKCRRVELAVIGAGGCIEEIRELVLKYGLVNYVDFYGQQEGAELDQIIEDYDLGVGALATHRLSSQVFAPLKHREYCARGIPFLFDGNDDAFVGFGGAIDVGRGDGSIDILSLLKSYDDVIAGGFTPDIIRTYAGDRLSWDAVFDDVINSLMETAG